MRTPDADDASDGEGGVGAGTKPEEPSPDAIEIEPAIEPEDENDRANDGAWSARGSERDQIQPSIRRMVQLGFLESGEEIGLIARIQEHGDTKARERMVYCNILLVVKIAGRYLNRGLPFLDLIQEGCLGLMQAVDDFDLHEGAAFSTHAFNTIRYAILHALSDQDLRTPMRVPDYTRHAHTVIKQTCEEFERESGQPPSDAELLTLLQDKKSFLVQSFSAEELARIRRDGYQIALSFEGPISQRQSGKEKDTGTIGSLLADTATAPTDSSARIHEFIREQSRWRTRVMDILVHAPSKQHAGVICRRFGLEEHPPMTFEEISVQMNVTAERVRQLVKRALEVLSAGLRLSIADVAARLEIAGGVHRLGSVVPEADFDDAARDLDTFSVLEQHARETPSGEWKIPAPVTTLEARKGWSPEQAEAAVVELIDQKRLIGEIPYACVYLTVPPANPNSFDEGYRKPWTKRSDTDAPPQSADQAVEPTDAVSFPRRKRKYPVRTQPRKSPGKPPKPK